MKERIVKIAELTFDKDLYPRMKTGWLTAYQYSQNMKAGAIFPPIVAGRIKGSKKLYVVDGWHRIEAKRLLKAEYVDAVIKDYDDKKELFVDAVKLNIVHGQRLSVQERARIINKLKEMKFEMEQISEIVRVPIERIEVFEIRNILGPDGKPLTLKSPLVKSGIEVKDASEVDQELLNVRSIPTLLEQLIVLLESDAYPLDNKAIKELSVKVYDLLGRKLKLVVA